MTRSVRGAALAKVLATVIGLGLALGALGFVLSLLYEIGVPLAVCLAGGLLLAAVGLSLARLPMEDSGELAPLGEPVTEQPSPLGDLHTVENRLAAAIDDSERFEDRVRRPLARLTAERLLQRHDLDWLERPAEARERLDPLLWELLTAPSGRFPASRRQAEVWVAAIEQL